MKKSQTKLLSIIYTAGVLTMLTSCSFFPASDPYIVDVNRQKDNFYYTPTAPTVPLLGNKNDFSLIMNGSLGENSHGNSVHAAFMPLKNLGLMASYSWLKNGDAPDDVGKVTNYELGAGYVWRFSPYWHFETYGGIGSGKVDNSHYTGYSKIKTNGFFLQPTISVSDKNQVMQFGFVSKFSLTKFDLRDTTFNNDREPVVTQQMLIIHDNPSQLFWEPGFLLRVGWKIAQFNLGYSFSADLTNKEMYRKKGLFTVGAVVKLNASNTPKNK